MLLRKEQRQRQGWMHGTSRLQDNGCITIDVSAACWIKAFAAVVP